MDELHRQLQTAEQQLNVQTDYYRQLQENILAVNQIRHDLNNQLTAAYRLLDEGQNEQVRRQLEETKENYRVMLARSQQESQEMARRAGEVIGEIDRISASLGKNTTEKSKNGLRDVLNSLRPKTEEK